MYTLNLVFALLVTIQQFASCIVVSTKDTVQIGGRLEHPINLYDPVQYNAVFSLLDPDFVQVYSAKFNKDFYYYTTKPPTSAPGFMYVDINGGFHIMTNSNDEFSIYLFPYTTNNGYLTFQNFGRGKLYASLQDVTNKKNMYIAGNPENTKIDMHAFTNTGVICSKEANLIFRVGDEGNGCIILQDTVFSSNGEMGSVVCLAEGDKKSTLFLEQDAMGLMKIRNFEKHHSLKMEYTGLFPPYFTYDTKKNVMVVEHGRRLEVDFGLGYNSTYFQGRVENGYYVIKYTGTIDTKVRSKCPCSCPKAPPATAPGVDQLSNSAGHLLEHKEIGETEDNIVADVIETDVSQDETPEAESLDAGVLLSNSTDPETETSADGAGGMVGGSLLANMIIVLVCFAFV